jgi:class 3 adenylate cyclase/DNA-binding winged helix-turn-helix (wHTH) protein/predicted ATPase/tRNA A37 threonylcarbamoyladenosine biosynthesis protein TsaE
VALEPKVFDLLTYLIQHHDRFISRAELYAQLWSQQYVSEAALTYCIAEARKAVGDTGRTQRVIKTVHGRGYRFIAPVVQRLPESTPGKAATAPAQLPALGATPPAAPGQSAPVVPLQQVEAAEAESASPVSPALWAERRQLTVLWCRGVVSSVQSRPLDPEEIYPVIQDVQRVCDQAIERFDGWMAQHFGDGFVVYFGYPRAHEDNARRAVHTALEIVGSVARLSQEFKRRYGVEFTVQVGIHTGIAVISALGSGERRVQPALGDTPHVAAQLASLAAPNTVVVSLAALQLIQGYFVCRALGAHIPDNASESLVMYQVCQESDAHSRLDVALATGLTPFVGREHEVELLCERWAQSKAGTGQVVVLSGEAGIGKSRLVHVLHEHLGGEAYTRLEGHCSPYAQQSPLYPVVEQVQHWLQWRQDDTPEVKLHKLEASLEATGCVLEEVVPLFAALCSLPLPERYPPLNLAPQRHKQQMLAAVLAWLLKEAERQPVCLVMEDLHWVDPSTLELLNLLIDQVPLARLLVVLTCRPDFTPPWAARSHVTHIVISRLTPAQSERMIEKVTVGKALPAEVQEQLLKKANGVPLFVEELTKMVLESGLVKEKEQHYELAGPLQPLAIPTTLQDSLMARLDRQSLGKPIAQLGATLGRAFSYAVLQAVSPLDEATLQHGLEQLVHAEILYQRGLPPQAQYCFKHVLIQEAAYQSLLRSTRQQYHCQIAQALEERFPEACEEQPELLAHHYMEAGLHAQAVVYLQRAGQRALERSAYVEAIAHLRQGLILAATLPDTSERLRHELPLYMALGVTLAATQGYAAPEVEHVYIQAREHCRQVGEPMQLFTVLRGLWLVYTARGELRIAYEQGEHLLHLAHRQQESTLILEAHRALGTSLFYLGELATAWTHLERGIARYEAQQHRILTLRYGPDPGMACLAYTAWILWLRGYPDQALERIRTALTLAHQCTHPFCRVFVLTFAVMLYQCRRELQSVSVQAAANLALAHQQAFPFLEAWAMVLQGWVLAEQGRGDEGIEQIWQGIMAYRATGAEVLRPYFLGLLAEAYGSRDRTDAGLETLDEALALVDRTGERFHESEFYRLKGQLLLARSMEHAPEAEACFHRALTLACRHQAKSLELRAAMSLSRLWRQQGQADRARCVLEEIYGWFTEGFDTGDLKEAKTLLDELR